MTSVNMTPREIIEYFFAHNPEMVESGKKKGIVFTYEEFVSHTPEPLMDSFNKNALSKVNAILNSKAAEQFNISLENAIDLVMSSFTDAIIQYMEIEDKLADIVKDVIQEIANDAGISLDDIDVNVTAAIVDKETFDMMKSYPGADKARLN